MSREERIEAAIVVLSKKIADWLGVNLTESAERRLIEGIFTAAYPELMSDPPTGWVAPWNATETIRDTIWGAVIPLPEDSQEAAEIDVWADVRDAHTKEQT